MFKTISKIIHNTSKAQNEFSMLICGDFNARSSNNPDFVLDDDSHHMNVLPDEVHAWPIYEPLFTRYRAC